MSNKQPAAGQRETETSRLLKLALDDIKAKYGPDSNAPKAYHNQCHSLDVIEAVTVLGNMAIAGGRIRPADLALLQLAAAFHDAEQNKGADNESASAALAAKAIKAGGQFNDQEIMTVQKLIKATRINISARRVKQQAGRDYRQQILADADLANLGLDTERYWQSLCNIFVETRQMKGQDNQAFRNYLIERSNFITNHTYLSDEANTAFPNKPANVQFIKDLIRSDKLRSPNKSSSKLRTAGSLS